MESEARLNQVQRCPDFRQRLPRHRITQGGGWHVHCFEPALGSDSPMSSTRLLSTSSSGNFAPHPQTAPLGCALDLSERVVSRMHCTNRFITAPPRRLTAIRVAASHRLQAHPLRQRLPLRRNSLLHERSERSRQHAVRSGSTLEAKPVEDAARVRRNYV